MVMLPRAAGKFISTIAKHVKINQIGVEKLARKVAEEINTNQLAVENFSQNGIHPKCDDPNALDWLFVVDTLNYCFWSKEKEEGWRVEGYTGYFALCAAINRAIKEGVDILNPKFYLNISDKELQNIFRSDTDVKIPLFDERLKCLHEVGGILVNNFESTFQTVVKLADKSAQTLLKLIVDNFPCFKDEAKYNGEDVAIYKRAQILVGDIWACFRNEGLGHFSDIDEITMFADYRVPQSLLHFGVFEYSDELSRKLKDGIVFNNGEDMEIEIRGCSIHACDLVAEEAKKLVNEGKVVNAVLVDHFLWDYRRANAQEILEKILPFHKTFCIYY